MKRKFKINLQWHRNKKKIEEFWQFDGREWSFNVIHKSSRWSTFTVLSEVCYLGWALWCPRVVGGNKARLLLLMVLVEAGCITTFLVRRGTTMCGNCISRRRSKPLCRNQHTSMLHHCTRGLLVHRTAVLLITLRLALCSVQPQRPHCVGFNETGLVGWRLNYIHFGLPMNMDEHLDSGGLLHRNQTKTKTEVIQIDFMITI